MNENGRKIPPNIENPIDNVLISLVSSTTPFLYKWGITPNTITSLSLITGLLATFLVLKHYYKTAALLILIAYTLDCLDGNLARKYNLVTTFGDIFDHVSDLTKFTSLCYVLYIDQTIPCQFKITMFVVLGILSFCMLVHFGCQERMYNKQSKDSLSPLEPLCFIDPKSTIHVTKYVGSGTFYMTLCLFVFIIPYTRITQTSAK